MSVSCKTGIQLPSWHLWSICCAPGRVLENEGTEKLRLSLPSRNVEYSGTSSVHVYNLGKDHSILALILKISTHLTQNVTNISTEINTISNTHDFTFIYLYNSASKPHLRLTQMHHITHVLLRWPSTTWAISPTHFTLLFPNYTCSESARCYFIIPSQGLNPVYHRRWLSNALASQLSWNSIPTQRIQHQELYIWGLEEAYNIFF